MLDVILVVPCFNEEKRLQVAEFRWFAVAHANVRFVMVDDGSDDQTGEVLRGLARFRPTQFEVLSLAENCGKAEAVRQGMVRAFELEADAVGFIDADLAAPLTEVLRMIDVLQRCPEINVVAGSRVALAGHVIDRRFFRRVLGGCFAAVATGCIGVPFRDTQCGLKLFRSLESIQSLFSYAFHSRWIFDIELFARLIAEQGRDHAVRQMYEMPLEKWSEVAGSKLKTGDFLKAIGELFCIYNYYIRSGRHRRPVVHELQRSRPKRAA
jgi:glycosyltransferase involved in cell wall biosynthesis